MFNISVFFILSLTYACIVIYTVILSQINKKPSVKALNVINEILCVTFKLPLILPSWLPEHEKARIKLIDHLTDEILYDIRPDTSNRMHCDASSIGYAGILLWLIRKHVLLPTLVRKLHLQSRTIVMNRKLRLYYNLLTLPNLPTVLSFHSCN
uniref:Uncharacterized protein n=1 Tax=Cacopsylla melanoneura TaxID=428564 RepID=A0A8D8YUP1_9HEMI